MAEIQFAETSLNGEESFWVMWYFLQEHYVLSEGTFDVSDILSASQPVGNGAPADSGMIHFWNDAIEKYRRNGIPPQKVLTK